MQKLLDIIINDEIRKKLVTVNEWYAANRTDLFIDWWNTDQCETVEYIAYGYNHTK